MRVNRVLAGALLAAALSASAAHSQSILGDQIHAAYFYPDLSSPCCGDISYSFTDFIVGPGSETTMLAAGQPIVFDFSANDLTIIELGTATFRSDPGGPGFYNGPVFTDVSGAHFGAILGVTGLDPSKVSIVGDKLLINWGGLTIHPEDEIVITFGAGGGVPEPAAWAMMLSGFFGMGAVLRRSRRRQQGAVLAA
jgi:hypothetical protein